MSVSTYEKYKESGVEWMGDVPKHWQVVRNKAVFAELDVRSETGKGELLSVSHLTGVTRRSEKNVNMTMAESLEGYKCCSPGDVVINTMWAWMGALGATFLHGLVSPSYNVYRPRRDGLINPAYYDFLCRTPQHVIEIKANSKGVWESRLRLYPEAFLNMRMPLPPIDEQNAIAAFLHRETTKIDDLVAEQQRLIELLQEKRQAVISNTVTKGLDPTAPMKDSGVEWLGEVPAHWEVVSARRLISGIEQGWSPECANRVAEVDEWAVLKAGCVNRGVFAPTENKALPENVDPIASLEVRAGDILMSRANGSPALVGSVAIVEETRPRLMLSDKIFRISTSMLCLPRYFVALFNSVSLRAQIVQAISGAEGLANNLPQAKLKEFMCPVPPPEEQSAIVAALGPRLIEIDLLASQIEASLLLLQERRAALISAAVTGKIDVRHLATAAAEAA